ncbi:hypothetical protein [Schaalia hyovaginalis]|uniref:hypothetical protein n=1 Tax=Schaalia hyovaginalis TaxID=29316 RepID=UPI0026F37503|nr:hypothetical protein [Schaalia hyovaginalis]MCI6557337.1 hypothetical protein [Schaalia hyovaginalis]MDY3094212.1 hypothetical protein [Schaalia hyovaginalis]MDY3664725.1 hypothetical protein [Schaalia hyovaginalis]
MPSSEETRVELLDLALNVRDTLDDMADLMPTSPYSMSCEQLQLDPLIQAMRLQVRTALSILWKA